jgi:hypothetical protein
MKQHVFMTEDALYRASSSTDPPKSPALRRNASQRKTNVRRVAGKKPASPRPNPRSHPREVPPMTEQNVIRAMNAGIPMEISSELPIELSGAQDRI